MRIDRVNVFKISLPFRGDYSISQKEGFLAKNIIVEVISKRDNIKGYGEGAPVEVVTGETQTVAAGNAIDFMQKETFPWELDEVSQIWDFVDSLPKGKENNAAISAVEIALLDFLGRYQNRAMLDYLPGDYYREPVRYGATITLGDRDRILELCGMIKKFHIRDLRIKLGRDFERNKESIKVVRQVLGENCELRIDPNGVWDSKLAFKHVSLIEKYGIKVVEEPLKESDPGFIEFVELMGSLGVTLMACETVTTLDDVERVINDGFYQMINIKLNRSGGFRRSLRMVETVRNSGLSFQIGCTLGESGILSAAGRVLCLLCSDAEYYDGSYDRFLLKQNITTKDVSFGMNGEAGPLNGSGLGVEVDYGNLLELSEEPSTVIIPVQS